MDDTDIAVLRLGHRPGRDDRMTTHVALTARALGADRVLVPPNAGDAVDTARDVTRRFGGPFDVEAVESPLAALHERPGRVVHLTMYGLPVEETVGEVRDTADRLTVVVGAGKVPFDAYELADWNVAVTNQPHSEVAALAVFLDRLFEGAQLDREWTGGQRRVVPQAEGKRVEDA